MHGELQRHRHHGQNADAALKVAAFFRLCEHSSGPESARPGAFLHHGSQNVNLMEAAALGLVMFGSAAGSIVAVGVLDHGPRPGIVLLWASLCAIVVTCALVVP
jgi:hypothetical protein